MQHRNPSSFWIAHLKTFAKVFVFGLVFFGWLMDASQFGTLLWSGVLAVFISGGGIYLSFDDLMTDEEVINHILAGQK